MEVGEASVQLYVSTASLFVLSIDLDYFTMC